MTKKGVALFLSIALLPLTASAEIVISEIMYDASGSDTKAEWIEIQNTGTSPVDISKWKVHDSSNHVLNAPPKNGSTGSLTMQPGAFLILAADAATFIGVFPNTHVSVIDTALSLGNSGATVSLVDASSTQMATASFTKDIGGNGTGESLQLISGTYQPGKPTPGHVNAAVRMEQPKPVVKTVVAPTKKVPTKTTSKKVTTKATDTSNEESVLNPETKESLVAGAAAVIPESSGSSMMPWLFAVLAVGVGTAGAVLVSRQKKSTEWNIEEIY